MVWYVMEKYEMVWNGIVRNAMLLNGMVCNGNGMVWYVVVWKRHNSLLVVKTKNHRDKSVIEGKKNYDFFHSIKNFEFF